MLAACVMTPFDTVNSPTGTSIGRPPPAAASCAPRRRRGGRSPARCGCRGCRRCPSRPRRVCGRGCEPGVMPSVVTLLQSHSSSSATSWASPVSVPCPISERAMRITQVSSGLIATQTLTSVGAGGALCACASSRPNGTRSPSARPPPATAAEPTMNVRRDSFAAFSATILFKIILFMANLPSDRWCRRRPPDARPRGCADRCRTGRYWSSLHRCPCRSAWDFS